VRPGGGDKKPNEGAKMEKTRIDEIHRAFNTATQKYWDAKRACEKTMSIADDKFQSAHRGFIAALKACEG